ncbi:MAG: hypothetical protein QW739_03975 [Candidatus Odinarchaeota archaeon]
MKRKNLLLLVLFTILLTQYFTPAIPVKSTPYEIFNYGVGVGPIPAELGMNVTIIGGYTLQYNPQTERGYAIFRLRNTTHIIFERIFTEPETYVERSVSFPLLPENWMPGLSGALAFAQLDLVIQTVTDIFYDNSSVYFYVQRASPACEIKTVTPIDEGNVKITFELYNSHNPAYKISNIIVNTQILSDSTILCENVSVASKDGLFSINFTPLEGSKNYNIRILTAESQQYKSSLFNLNLLFDYNPKIIETQGAPYLIIIISVIIPLGIVITYLIIKQIKKKTDLIIF